MELTFEQQRAARACGFSFFPATEAQVQRFTMQKRIFWIGAQPFMVTRDGAFWEPHGTLTQVIEEWARHELEAVMAEAERLPQPREAPVSIEVPPPAQEGEPAEPEVASLEETARTPARSARRRRGARATFRHEGEDVAVASAEVVITNRAAASTSDAVEVAPETEADSAPEGQRAVRQSRTRQPKEPRWATAGKERRGRLK